MSLAIHPSTGRTEHMVLTQDHLDAYVGGELEVQNRTKNYLWRGEIASATLTGNNDDGTEFLTVHFTWFAQMNGSFEWIAGEPTPYVIETRFYSGDHDPETRCITLESDDTGERTLFFPPHGDKLDTGEIRDFSAYASEAVLL